MPARPSSLRWLYLAVLGPLFVLAGLAWWGMRAQLKAAWTDAREEAAAVTEARATELAQDWSAALVTVPEYPVPPIPGESSEEDAILAGDDLAALKNLRDSGESTRSSAGLPRRVLAAFRIAEMEPSERNRQTLVSLATNEEPSILTPRALAYASPEIRQVWSQAETARHLAAHREGAATGFWETNDAGTWWIQPSADSFSFLPPIELTKLSGEIAQSLPAWASVTLALPGQPKEDSPAQRLLHDTAIPFDDGLTLQIWARPEILEKGLRRQQGWTLALLGTALVTATIALVSIQRTVTRERRLAELKSQFVASVSHELRAPLGSIRLMAEALQEKKTSQPARFHTLIAREGARLSHLVENVLDFARIEEGKKSYRFEDSDVAALVRESLTLMEPLARERKVALKSELIEITAKVDAAAIQQALINLLDNALKFSPPETTVELVIRQETDFLTIAIRDQGPGIPEQEQRAIFERFYRLGNELRRETPGTGIGLSIVKHIAEAHGGSVSVRNSQPDGATFTLKLPLEPCASS
jgi:signal transduction histidine kinase